MAKVFNTTKEEVCHFITGEERPKFLTAREKRMIDKFVTMIENERNNYDYDREVQK